MGLVSKFNAWRRKLQEQPGTTIDLEPMQALLPLIEEREAELSELTDDELRAAATALHQRDDPQDFVEACALGREAAKRALDERPMTCSCSVPRCSSPVTSWRWPPVRARP